MKRIVPLSLSLIVAALFGGACNTEPTVPTVPGMTGAGGSTEVGGATSIGGSSTTTVASTGGVISTGGVTSTGGTTSATPVCATASDVGKTMSASCTTGVCTYICQPVTTTYGWVLLGSGTGGMTGTGGSTGTGGTTGTDKPCWYDASYPNTITCAAKWLPNSPTSSTMMFWGYSPVDPGTSVTAPVSGAVIRFNLAGKNYGIHTGWYTATGCSATNASCGANYGDQAHIQQLSPEGMLWLVCNPGCDLRFRYNADGTVQPAGTGTGL